MDIDGSDVRRLTSSPEPDASPSWAPDGSSIVFARGGIGELDIFVMRSDGTHVRRLTGVPGEDDKPSWSPDGREIAFHSERSGTFQIYAMDPHG